MAEKLRTKIRVAGMDQSEVITSKEGITSAVWTALPLTLRADQLVITPGDVTETEIMSHENDIPEDYDAQGTGSSATGSFIKASMAQLKELVGGEVIGEGDDIMFLQSSQIQILNQAIRFRLKDGGAIIIPNAKGYVNIDINAGATDGMFKCPFKFVAQAQIGFEYGLVIQNKATVAAQGAMAPLMAPMSAPVTTESETETKKK